MEESKKAVNVGLRGKTYFILGAGLYVRYLGSETPVNRKPRK